MFELGSDIHTHSTRQSDIIRRPLAITRRSQFSIRHLGPHAWNCLPATLRNMDSFYLYVYWGCKPKQALLRAICLFCFVIYVNKPIFLSKKYSLRIFFSFLSTSPSREKSGPPGWDRRMP